MNMAKGDRGGKVTAGGTYEAQLECIKKYDSKKKKIMLRLNEAAKIKLDRYADRHAISLNELILQALEEKTGLHLH